MSAATDVAAVLEPVVTVAGAVVIAFFVALYAASAVLLLRAIVALWSSWDVRDDDVLAPILASEALPTVSVVVTGVTPRTTLVDNVHALLSLRYPRYEVVLVHDDAASHDLAALVDEFALYPVPPAVLVNVPTGPVRGYYRSRRHGKLFVIDKASGNLADDLNASLNASRYPYVVTMHAGTILTRDALTRLMRPFLVGERVAAVCAAVRLDEPATAHRERGAPRRARRPGIETIVRLREHVFFRLGWNDVGGQLPPPGAILLHRREHLLELDGYRRETLDPELDLVARLRASLRAQRLADAIPTIPDVVARATTAGAVSRPGARVAPSRLLLEILRARRGTDLVIRHRPAPLLAAIHLVGSVLLAPLVELAGYLLLVLALVTGGAAGWYVPLFLLAVPGFALLLSLWAIALEMALAGDAATWPRAIGLAVLAVAEQVGHRQWRMVEGVHGVLSGLRGGSRHDASDIGAAASDEDLALAATERVQTR